MQFSPPQCEINTGKLDQAADDMLGIVGRITGKSGDLEALFNNAAMEFSELIAEDIHSTASENHSAWTTALTSCWHVWGVITKWSTDVERYKDKIAGLQEEWDTAVGNNFGLEVDDAGVVESREALASAFNERAQGYWETLEEEAQSNSENLQGGPTVANLRELIDAGVLGFAAYNATRQIMYYPSNFDTGERDAENLMEYLSGNKEPDDEYYRLLAQLNAINALAADAERNGEDLRGYELDYLEEFYAALDEETEDGVVGLPEEIDGDHFSGDQRENLLGTLGDGVLTLSDEKVGGGYESLPGSVRDVVEGPDFSGDSTGRGAPNILQTWRDQASGLEQLFAHTDDNVEGGAEFSTRLMDSASREVERFELPGADGDDSTMSGLLDVATRNNGANHAILTGEYPPGVDAGLPWSGENAEGQRVTTLGNLYSHDWQDDGAVIRRITDWIADGPADGDSDTDGVLRESALMGLMDLMENEDFKDAVFNTGSHVTDEDGTKWHDVSSGQLNPELADGFADIFISFQDDFANTDGVADNVDLGLGDGVEIADTIRADFTQLTMGDPDAADRVYTEALLRTAESMEDYSGNKGEREYDSVHEAGSLQGLVEVALQNESTMRQANDQEFIDYRNSVNNSVIDVLGGGAGDQNVPGLAVELAKAAGKEAFEVSGSSARPNVEMNGDWFEEESMMGYALGVAAENDEGLMEELKEEGIAKEDSSGEPYIPPHHSDWGISKSDIALSNYYHRVDGELWPDGGSDARDAVEDFVGAFGRSTEKWQDQIVDENGVRASEWEEEKGEGDEE